MPHMDWISDWLRRQEKPDAQAKLLRIDDALNNLEIGSPEYEELIVDYGNAAWNVRDAST